jgi:hypothetical protein
MRIINTINIRPPIIVDAGPKASMSSPAQTLGSCVRIQLEAWMSVRVSSVYVMSCLGSGLASD